MNSPSTTEIVSATVKRPHDGDTLAYHWFHHHGWKPFPFQREVWQVVARGGSGLLHATTGSGKTYAVWLSALNRFAQPQKAKCHPATQPVRKRS